MPTYCVAKILLFPHRIFQSNLAIVNCSSHRLVTTNETSVYAVMKFSKVLTKRCICICHTLQCIPHGSRKHEPDNGILIG